MNSSGDGTGRDARRAAAAAKSPASPVVVLSQVHVSCLITAANRATPVFEVVPERCCVRVATKPPGEGAAPAASSTTTTASSPTGTRTLTTVEWDFHTLFSSSSPALASDFYRDVTLPAFQNACDGWNANIVAWGVHPTQKFRLLFGKSTGAPTVSAGDSGSTKEILELYGQLGGLLHEIFASSRAAAPQRLPQPQPQLASVATLGWRVGISSWIIVNNQAIDLLKPVLSPSATATAVARQPTSVSSAPLSFVSVEATSFASACRILQAAKTNRIVMKQNAEHAHFFLRIALFRDGQVSTVHFVDLVDLKDFKEDPVAVHEKQELFEILYELRQPPVSPRCATTAAPTRTADGSFVSPSTPTVLKSRDMVLSNFILPLLTANAKTFLHANVIDSRASLRESVQLLNAVANVKGFACACKRLRGVDFVQLGFQTLPDDFLRSSEADKDATLLDGAATKAMAAVAIGESLLSRLASGPVATFDSTGQGVSAGLSSSLPLAMPTSLPFTTPDLSSILAADVSSFMSSSFTAGDTERRYRELPTSRRDSFSAVPMESETLAWLESFSQRKREILGGKIDTIVPLPTRVMTSRELDTKAYSGALESTLFYLEDDELLRAASAESVSRTRGMPVHASADLISRHYDVITSTERDKIRRSSSEPLPIVDSEDDIGYCRGASEEASALGDLAACLSESQHDLQQLRVQFQDDNSACFPSASEHSLGARHREHWQYTSEFSRHDDDSSYEAPLSFPNDTRSPAPTARSAPIGNAYTRSRDSVSSVHSATLDRRSSESAARPTYESVAPPPQAARPPTAFPSPPPPPRSVLTQHGPQTHQQLFDTLESANVPLKAMAPANLDGLDHVTASKIQAAEATLLRKNYDALLTIVQEQQQQREAADARAADVTHDRDELRASFEVQVETMKLQNVALRSKVRALEHQSALPKVFEQYEQELEALLKEVQQLRDRNVLLELKVRPYSGCMVLLTHVCRPH